MKCINCGKEFINKKKQQKYCSSSCREKQKFLRRKNTLRYKEKRHRQYIKNKNNPNYIKKKKELWKKYYYKNGGKENNIKYKHKHEKRYKYCFNKWRRETDKGKANTLRDRERRNNKKKLIKGFYPLDEKVIKEVRIRDEGVCVYCQDKIDNNSSKKKETFDHFNPCLPATLDNLFIACKSCNSSKLSIPPKLISDWIKKKKFNPKQIIKNKINSLLEEPEKESKEPQNLKELHTFISNGLDKGMKEKMIIEKKEDRLTDINPSYSYHKGDASKNDRINFKHWNDLLYEKEKGEKDTTYSSLWLFRKAKMIPPFTDLIGSSSPAEAKREGVEYFSEFNPLVSQNISNYWSDENDIVLDPFAGRTRGIVSGLTHRKYFGFEISPTVHKAVVEVIESGKDKFDEGFKPIIYNDDSFNIDKYNIPNVDCIFSCPPYWNLERYESTQGQLSDINDYNLFLERFKQIMEKCIDKLKDNGFICLVVGDFRKDEKLISFESDVTKIMESISRIVLWDKIVLQNIGHGWASRKFGSIKHKRIVAKVTEYLLVFKKI